MAGHPHISVLLPTRNRPADLRRCLDSLTSVRYPTWDVLLLDQSDDDRSRTLAEAFAQTLPNLTYQRMRERGCARAYNTGLELTSGVIVAFLNDDCTVAADWLAAVAAVFERHPQAGIVFGSVKRAGDGEEHFIPAYDARIERQVRGRWSCLRLGGMGACMYIRRAVAQSVGPFDIRLGPGAHFASGADDVDYRYRCLAHGYSGVTTPAIVVEHHGGRDYASGAAGNLLDGYAYSAGAMVMKLVRCGELPALLLLARSWSYLAARDLRRCSAGRNTPTFALIGMGVRGMRDSFQFRVDRRRCLYGDTTKPRACD
jgi:glycosyltransferase involved in cell wall biosynthesis